jgi:hypothetical protein
LKFLFEKFSSGTFSTAGFGAATVDFKGGFAAGAEEGRVKAGFFSISFFSTTGLRVVVVAAGARDTADAGLVSGALFGGSAAGWTDVGFAAADFCDKEEAAVGLADADAGLAVVLVAGVAFAVASFPGTGFELVADVDLVEVEAGFPLSDFLMDAAEDTAATVATAATAAATASGTSTDSFSGSKPLPSV